MYLCFNQLAQLDSCSTSKLSGDVISFCGCQNSFLIAQHQSYPIPAVARSKASVCIHQLAGIVGSNPVGGMDVCLLRVLCLVQVAASASARSFVQGSPIECVCVCVSDCIIRCDSNLLHLQWVARRGETKKEKKREGKQERKKETNK